PTTPEGVHVADGGVQSCRGEDADAGDLSEGFQRRNLLNDAFELPLNFLHPVLEGADFLIGRQSEAADPDGEQLLLLLQELRELADEPICPGWPCETELTQEAAQRVDPGRSSCHPLGAHPMEGDDRLLILALDRHRMNAGTAERLEKRLAVCPVGLVSADVRADIVRW